MSGSRMRVRGAPGGTRTHNICLSRAALYPLNYGGVVTELVAASTVASSFYYYNTTRRGTSRSGHCVISPTFSRTLRESLATIRTCQRPAGSAPSVVSELSDKLDSNVTLSFDRMFAFDLSGRARAFQSMVGGGMDVAKAAALAGLMGLDQ